MIAWRLVFPGPVNVFFRLYAFHEPLLAAVAGWTIVAAAVVWRRARRVGWNDAARGAARAERARGGSRGWLMFLVSLVTWYRVHHGVLLTMDEFTSDFQARILAHGEVRATVPKEWQPYLDAMAPVFTAYRDLNGGWLSQYLPGYALMKTPFVMTRARSSPQSAARGAVGGAARGVARRLWPDEGLRPWMALAFFVTSSEVLMTSGTGYSMPAHLALNLLWLWLYQRGDARSWGLALAVGVLALGLHNPMPHALFVAPFLVRLLRERRWRRVGRGRRGLRRGESDVDRVAADGEPVRASGWPGAVLDVRAAERDRLLAAGGEPVAAVHLARAVVRCARGGRGGASCAGSGR